MSVISGNDQVLEESDGYLSTLQIIQEVPSESSFDSSPTECSSPRPIPLVSNSTIAVLEAPSTAEQVARVADRIFSTIAKTGVTLFSLFTGSILVERRVACTRFFPDTAEEHMNTAARISIIVAGICLAGSAIAGNIADNKESDRVKKCFEEMKKENGGGATSIVLVHFPK